MESLREARLRVGLSQQALADAAEISIRMVQYIEAGKRVPSVIVALAIAKALAVRVEDIEWDGPQAKKS